MLFLRCGIYELGFDHGAYQLTCCAFSPVSLKIKNAVSTLSYQAFPCFSISSSRALIDHTSGTQQPRNQPGQRSTSTEADILGYFLLVILFNILSYLFDFCTQVAQAYVLADNGTNAIL